MKSLIDAKVVAMWCVPVGWGNCRSIVSWITIYDDLIVFMYVWRWSDNATISLIVFTHLYSWNTIHLMMGDPNELVNGDYLSFTLFLTSWEVNEIFGIANLRILKDKLRYWSKFDFKLYEIVIFFIFIRDVQLYMRGVHVDTKTIQLKGKFDNTFETVKGSNESKSPSINRLINYYIIDSSYA